VLMASSIGLPSGSPPKSCMPTIPERKRSLL
jgi:hypothetical protein